MIKFIRMFTIFLVSLFLIILSIWVYGVYTINDFKIPNQSLSNYKNVLIIYPHADDEYLL